MIPSNSFTSTPAIGNFQYPYSEPYDPLYQNVLGGISIGDSSRGRQYKIWNITYVLGNIIVSSADNPNAFTLVETDVTAISLAFDNNMGLVIAWQTTTGSKLYFYDSITSSYVTSIFSGTTSCRVCIDDARDFNSQDSDVIFSYTLNNNLYWRQQRDRYATERLIGPTTRLLKKVAQTTGNRLQFQLL